MSYPEETWAMRRRGGVREYVDGPVPAVSLNGGGVHLVGECVVEVLRPASRTRLRQLAELFPPEVVTVARPVADAHKRADSGKEIVNRPDLPPVWGGNQEKS